MNTPTVIIGPDGQPVSKQTMLLDLGDAELLRAYRRFLLKYRLREALFCQDCGHADLEDGCRAYVQDGKILIECRCTARLFLGVT